MGWFSNRHKKHFCEGQDGVQKLLHSPLGLWAASHRARVTLGISDSDSKPSEFDSGLSDELFGGQLLAPLVSKSVFFSARQSWLGKTDSRDAELFVLAIMYCYAVFVAVQHAKLTDSDRLFLELAPMAEFQSEFLFVDNPVKFNMGDLAQDASSAIQEAMRLPSGQRFYQNAGAVLTEFWLSGHSIDARKFGDMFKPMLKHVV